jgi:hypothetical protein
VEYMERINYLSNSVLRLDQDEREIVKMEIMLLELLSFADIDDLTLSHLQDDLSSIDWTRDKLTINRHRGMINALRWVIEGR